MNSWLNKVNRFLPFAKPEASTSEPMNDSTSTENDSAPWWGHFLIGEEQSRFFKIGHVVLCLDRYQHEWHITTHREGEKPFKSFSAQASNKIVLNPSLPDRPLLCKLERPFYIPSGETLTLYASSPVWICLEAGNPSIKLDEISTEDLADTWHGKNTLSGELCYASETHCSAQLDDLLHDTTHVITPVSIINRSKKTLLLEHLKIPMPLLSVYADAENHLWTEQVSLLQNNQHTDEFEAPLVQNTPKILKNPKLLSPSRLGKKPRIKHFFNPFKWK